MGSISKCFHWVHGYKRIWIPWLTGGAMDIQKSKEKRFFENFLRWWYLGRNRKPLASLSLWVQENWGYVFLSSIQWLCFTFYRIISPGWISKLINFQIPNLDDMANKIWNQSRMKCILIHLDLAVVNSRIRTSSSSMRTSTKIIYAQQLLIMRAATWYGMNVLPQTKCLRKCSCLLIQYPFIHSISIHWPPLMNQEWCFFFCLFIFLTKSDQLQICWHNILSEEKLDWESEGLVSTSAVLWCT